MNAEVVARKIRDSSWKPTVNIECNTTDTLWASRAKAVKGTVTYYIKDLMGKPYPLGTNSLQYVSVHD